MSIVLRVLFLRMFAYINTLYYSIVLLVIVLSLLFILVSNMILHSLTMLILAIVYIGAMMILIGYICAICPNLILLPTSISLYLYLFVVLISFIFIPLNMFISGNQSFTPIVSYFYTSSGMLVFYTLVFMLFITLLIVTSQYMTPKGPFRSVTI